MSGIILDRGLSGILLNSPLHSKYLTDEMFSALNDALFSVFMYDQMRLSQSLLSLMQTGVGRILEREGMVQAIPEEFLVESNDYISLGLVEVYRGVPPQAWRDSDYLKDFEAVLEADRDNFKLGERIKQTERSKASLKESALGCQRQNRSRLLIWFKQN